MADTEIEWATKVWNPTTGCDRVSTGCDHCYALTMAKRLKGMGSAKYQRDGDPRTSGPGFGVSHHVGSLTTPLDWRKPQRIFVNSMSDLFHDQVPEDFIAQVFAVMADAGQHTFQVLTKRHARMRSLLSSDDFQRLVHHHSCIAEDRDYGDWWPLPNVWIGVSAENQQWADIRIPALLDTPAAIRFVSAEPLLGPINLSGYLRCPDPDSCGPGPCSSCATADNIEFPNRTLWSTNPIDWVIAGGESGPGARPMHPWWAESLHQQCEKSGTAFLFKQWGAWTPLAPMRDGKFDFRNGIVMTDDGNTYAAGDLDYPNGPRRGEAYRTDFPHHRPTSMYQVGKKRAGRELHHDGRTFDQYPEAVTA